MTLSSEDDSLRQVKRIVGEFLLAEANGQEPDRSALLAEHPALAEQIVAYLALHDRLEAAAPTLTPPSGSTAPHPAPRSTPALGARVRYFGDYELQDEIARGGMGVVYRARQVSLNRIVALKMILSGQLAGEEDVRRFRAEAEAAANMDHPGIVPIFEVGEHEGQQYFSMGFIEGLSLASKLANGPLPAQEAATLIEGIARAVAFAHESGVIHRDLKPGNVLLDRQGQPRVTDFGLAKQIRGDDDLTATGQVLGTPSYMAPEQARGGEVDRRSDVYALGAVLYAMLAARPPHQAASPFDTIRSVIEREPPAPRRFDRSIPRVLETICLKALSKEPDRRYATATDFADDVGRYLHNEPIKARRVGLAEKSWLWCRRNRKTSASIGVAVVVLLMTSFAFWQWRSRTRATDLVQAVMTADVEQVPDLIADLESLRTWADPRLEEANRRADRFSREKLNTSLALLPVDDGQAEYLVEHLLATEHPPEVPVIVEQLVSHAELLRSGLWEVMSETGDEAGSRQLRAACALATFDAENPRWSDARDDVAMQLVGVSTVYLQTWLKALQPAGNDIAAAMVDVFGDSDRTPLEHSIAKDVLVDFGSDLPTVLAEAIQTTDEFEFVELYTLLAAHADAAIPLLEVFLQERPQRDWQDAPLDPAWIDPSEELAATFEDAGGLIADEQRFAYCQTLSLVEFNSLAQELEPCGYRPPRVRPYVVNNTINVAATWRRDGRKWKWLVGTADEVRQRDQEFQAEGFVPYDVTVFPDNRAVAVDTPRFATVWVAAGEDEPARRLLVGLPAGDVESAAEALVAAGFGQLLTNAVQPFDGTGVLVSMIAQEGEPLESETYAGTDDFRFNDLHLHLLQYDLQATDAQPWQWLFVKGPSASYRSAIWLENETYESTTLTGLDPSEHASRAQPLLTADYRLVAIDVIESAEGELQTVSLWHRPLVPEAVKEDLAQRQANAAVALLRMGEGQAVWPLLRHREYAEDVRQPDDPRRRTYIIHRLSPRGADPQDLLAQMRVEDDVSIRRALLLALGEFSTRQLEERTRQAFTNELADVYRRHPDAGLHAAAAWLLRTWGQDELIQDIARDLGENEETFLARQAETPRDWYVTGEGHTMVVMEPGELLAGSHISSDPHRFADEERHRKRIPRRFALGATEVTRAQYRRFEESRPDATIPLADDPYLGSMVRTDNSPITAMEWYEAAAYCNWLSEQEGIAADQWVYQPNDAGEFGPGMRIREGLLNLVGYRLPSEAEWEYACLAGAATPRHYGRTDEVLDRYAWFRDNSELHTWPVGLLKPNDFGLFDMHGNAWNWCQGRRLVSDYFALEDSLPGDIVEDETPRILRGGSCGSTARNARAAIVNGFQPSSRDTTNAFRPARTLPPVVVSPSSAAVGRRADIRQDIAHEP